MKTKYPVTYEGHPNQPVEGDMLVWDGSEWVKAESKHSLISSTRHKISYGGGLVGHLWQRLDDVNLASTGNVDLEEIMVNITIDGSSLSPGDTVLLWKQTDWKENGIYIATGTTEPLGRLYFSWSFYVEKYFKILSGNTYANKWFETGNNYEGVVGTNDIEYGYKGASWTPGDTTPLMITKQSLKEYLGEEHYPPNILLGRDNDDAEGIAEPIILDSDVFYIEDSTLRKKTVIDRGELSSGITNKEISMQNDRVYHLHFSAMVSSNINISGFPNNNISTTVILVLEAASGATISWKLNGSALNTSAWRNKEQLTSISDDVRYIVSITHLGTHTVGTERFPIISISYIEHPLTV